MNDVKRQLRLDQPATYQIKVRGRLKERWSSRFDDLAVSVESSDDGLTITTLTGTVSDQAALHGLLARIRDMGLPLLLVRCIDAPEGHPGRRVEDAERPALCGD